MQIPVGREGLWQRFCAGFHLDPDTPGMATTPERVEHRKLVNQMVEEAFGSWETDELLAELDRIGVPAGRIRSIDEVYAWEQTRSQGLLVDVDHDTLGPITLPGPPLRFCTSGGAETTHTATITDWLTRDEADEPQQRTRRTRPLRLPIVATPPDCAGHGAAPGSTKPSLTGEARIHGRRVALLVGEFAFVGRSIGLVASRRITAAVRRATRERLPLLALPTSGGTRMQEGSTASVQMATITSAVGSLPNRGG